MQSDETGRGNQHPVNSDYLPRGLQASIEEALTDTPVVCLLGPRQCGKSTLAQHIAPNRHYLSLDDRNYLDLALNDPQGFVDQLPERVTIDEVQRAPELTLAIKRNVDVFRIPGRFLLTGSANLLQLPRLADSLAGRMECLFLHPFTESEKKVRPGRFLSAWLRGDIKPSIGEVPHIPPSDLPLRLVEGGYPEAFQRPPKRARNWQRQYVRSIIERDIHDVASVKDGSDVSRLLMFTSHQTAQLLNVSTIANALQHSRSTVEHYLDMLEKLFLVHRLPAWHSNNSKRLIKAPKLHLCDSGLAAALSGLDAGQWNEERPRFGHLLESWVFQQLKAMADWTEEEMTFWHYRDKDKVEVDFVIEVNGLIWGVEVKAAASVRPSDGKGLQRLAEVGGKRFQGGVVLYDGHDTLPINREKNLLAVPFSKLWEL